MRISDWSSDVCSSDVMKATLSFASMPEGEELIDLNSLEDLVQIIERYQEKVIVSLAHRKGATLSIVIYNEEVEHVGEIAEMTDEQLTTLYLSADPDYQIGRTHV